METTYPQIIAKRLTDQCANVGYALVSDTMEAARLLHSLSWSLKETIELAEQAMNFGNNNGAEYEVDELLADARSKLLEPPHV